ncbi:MAG: Na+/H+ antiporter NhaC family protein [Prochloraceae cyanobacterium]
MTNKRIRSIFQGIVLVSISVVALSSLSRTEESSHIQGWLSLVPPLVAILLAWVGREAIWALFVGVWTGAWIAHGLSLSGIVKGFFDTTEVYILGALTDSDHASIILFTLMLGGMIGIVTKNGGVTGMVNQIVPWANSPKRAQLVTGFLGLAIFFDDYANTLFVGSSMRSITDRLGISREKLAYIVDSTAAPVACLALVSTWIGYQIGLIKEATDKLEGLSEDAYSIFWQSIPYSFYPLLAIFFVFAVAWSQRDFGPMFDAECRARQMEGRLSAEWESGEIDEENFNQLKANSKKPPRALNAILPLMALLGTTLMGLYLTGRGKTGAGASLQIIMGQADPYKALMWGSQISLFAAASLSLAQGIMSWKETFDACLTGLKSMLQPIIVLLLAWALSAVLKELGTSQFLISMLGERLRPEFLPTIVFLLSAVIAFASGTSWGTMAILLPLVIPLTWAVLTSNDLGLSQIFYASIASVLAGAVWGDHCSPVSDTTILASIASRCNHIDHVRTQLPYALLVAGVALLLGTIPTGLGVPWWASLVMGGAVLLLILRRFGKNPEVKSVPRKSEEAIAR